MLFSSGQSFKNPISFNSESIYQQNVRNFDPIFEQNASINFEPTLKSVNFGPISEKSVNFEHFVNARWTHY